MLLSIFAIRPSSSLDRFYKWRPGAGPHIWRSLIAPDVGYDKPQPLSRLRARRWAERRRELEAMGREAVPLLRGRRRLWQTTKDGMGRPGSFRAPTSNCRSNTPARRSRI